MLKSEERGWKSAGQDAWLGLMVRVKTEVGQGGEGVGGRIGRVKRVARGGHMSGVGLSTGRLRENQT